MSFSAAVSHANFASWKLILEGETQDDTCSTRGSVVSSRRPKSAPIIDGLPSVTDAHRSAWTGEASTRRTGDPSKYTAVSTALVSWETAAIALHRDVRRYRYESASHKNREAAGLASTSLQHRFEKNEDAEANSGVFRVPRPFLALFLCAFPSLPTTRTSSTDATTTIPGEPSSAATPALPVVPLPSPLLLQFFLCAGFPLQWRHWAGSSSDVDLPGATAAPSLHSAYAALLRSAGEQLVRWFVLDGRTSLVGEGRKRARADVTPHQNEDEIPEKTDHITPDEISSILPRAFPPSLLPDVLQQLIAAYRMSPRVAAAWMVRVYLAVLQAEHDKFARELREEHQPRQPQRRQACEDAAPLQLTWPLLPSCLERIETWARVMRDAVYQLQGNVLPLVCLDERVGCCGEVLGSCARAEGGSDAEDGGDEEERDAHAFVPVFPSSRKEGRTPSTEPDREDAKEKAEWKYLYMIVLQQVTSLLLRGLFSLPTDAEPLESRSPRHPYDAPPPSTTAEVLMPAAPVSYFCLYGLLRVAFLTRIQADAFAVRRVYQRIGRDGHCELQQEEERRTPLHAGVVFPPPTALTSEKRVLHAIEKQWHAFVQLATRQLANLPCDYHNFVPLLDFIVTLR